MKAAELYRHLQTGAIAPVYLFTGDADLQVEEAWSRILREIVPESARRFNGERFRAKENPASHVLSIMGTLPMFGAKRLVLVQGIEHWAKDQMKLLLSYLQKPVPSSCLVLTCSQSKGMEKIETAIEAVGVVVKFAPLTEWDAPKWAQARAKQQGKLLTPKAASFLTEWVGVEEFALAQELEKLILYVGEAGTIDVADVQQVVSYQRSFSSFEMMRFVGQRDASKALMALRNLMLADEAPLAILGLLARQVRLIWQVKDGQDRGMGTPDMGRRLNLYPKILQQYAEQASAFSLSRLEGIHESIRSTDVALKSSGGSPETILESLITSMCLSKKE
jgi:DNA polymerase III subunit delta